MNKWHLSPMDVLPHLRQWGHTTTVMQLRIMDPTAGMSTRDGDVYLFVMAARQTYRFAQLSENAASGHTRLAVGEALSAFRATSSDVKEAPDVLDHLDSYLGGRGWGFTAAEPDAYATEWLQVFKPSQMWTERAEGTYRLHISPVPGKMLTVDVTRDGAAVRRLVDAVTLAVDA